MPYVLSLSLLVLGLVLLALLLIRTFRSLRRLRATQKLVLDDVADRGGMLKARLAGVRVGLAQRRRAAPARTY